MASNQKAPSSHDNPLGEIFTDPIGFRTRSHHKTPVAQNKSIMKDKTAAKHELLPYDSESDSSPLSSLPSSDPPSPSPSLSPSPKPKTKPVKRVSWADQVELGGSQKAAYEITVSSGRKSLPAKAGSTPKKSSPRSTGSSSRSVKNKRKPGASSGSVAETPRVRPRYWCGTRISPSTATTSSYQSFAGPSNAPDPAADHVQHGLTSSMTAGESVRNTLNSEEQGNTLIKGEPHGSDTELDMKMNIKMEPHWPTSSLRETQRPEWIKARFENMSPEHRSSDMWAKEDIY